MKRNLEYTVPSLEDASQYIEANGGLIRSIIIKKFNVSIADMDELMQIGRMGMYEGLMQYNPNMGLSLTSFVCLVIHRKIHSYYYKKIYEHNKIYPLIVDEEWFVDKRVINQIKTDHSYIVQNLAKAIKESKLPFIKKHWLMFWDYISDTEPNRMIRMAKKYGCKKKAIDNTITRIWYWVNEHRKEIFGDHLNIPYRHNNLQKREYTKICPKCKKEYRQNNYYNSAGRRSAYCKSCSTKLSLASYWEKNKRKKDLENLVKDGFQ